MNDISSVGAMELQPQEQIGRFVCYCLGVLVIFTMMGSAAAQSSAIPPMHQLMPVPAQFKFMNGRLNIDSGFTVAVCASSGERASHAVDRALRRLEIRTGFTFSRNSSTPSPKLTVCAKAPGQKIQTLNEDESYSLKVDSSHAELNAPTDLGVLRGLETFLQLLEGDRKGFYLPGVEVQDKPRFPWRGLLIDVCRHWEPVEVIKRNLDGMAAVKLNVFHWHLSEDQGFRVESKVFPKLHELGSDGLYYTQDQIREVVAYARERGIRVIPEFDMPGHSTSWFVGYPEFSSGNGPYSIDRNFGISIPVFDPTREEVYRFIDKFIGEMVPFFPDAYWHVGGDEVENKQWDDNPSIQAFKQKHQLKDNAALQTYFNERLFKILQKHGKKMVGWDEIMNPKLPKDIVVQSWRGQESLGAGARQGFNGILSAGYYLDHNESAAQLYSVDPLPGNELSAAESSKILGGEVCMWGESINPEKIDSRIWPRTAAIAERLWSDRDVKDVADMYRRLGSMSNQLEEFGLLHKAAPEIMLRRYANGTAMSPMRKLLALIEPANTFERGHNQLTPLTSLTDVAIPDPSERFEIEALVQSAVKNSADRQTQVKELEKRFQTWRDLPVALALESESPRITEANDIARDVARLGTVGSEALLYLSTGIPAPKEWLDQNIELLKRLEETKAVVRVAITPSMRKLVMAAAQRNGDLKSQLQ
jgi:hexosaminidase